MTFLHGVFIVLEAHPSFRTPYGVYTFYVIITIIIEFPDIFSCFVKFVQFHKLR